MSDAVRSFTGAAMMHLRLYGLNQPRLIVVVAQPAAMTAVALVVLRDAASGDAFARVLVGGALAGTWGAVLGAAMFTLRREREWYGTFALVSATPAPLGSVLAGYLAAEAALSLPGIVVSFAVGFAIVGTGAAVASPILFAVSLCLPCRRWRHSHSSSHRSRCWHRR